jgi:hypothetical protein
LEVVDLNETGEDARDSTAGLRLRDACPAPALFLLEYSDGFRAALLHCGAASGGAEKALPPAFLYYQK